jgi:TfoX/Sxy family transcriptional regulator of competence genes
MKNKGDFMASTLDFVRFVCEQILGAGFIEYKKMFGEYMVYCKKKPVVLICDNTAYIKKTDFTAQPMSGADEGFPYEGAKLHYILDIDDGERAVEIIKIVERNTAMPVKKKKKEK